MAWVGYNTSIADVETIVKPDGGVFSTTSKPWTVADVEKHNLAQYYWINAQLRKKGVTVPVTAVADVFLLGFINTCLTCEVCLQTKWRTLEQVGESPDARKWGDLGRSILKSLIDGGAFLSDDTTQAQIPTGSIGLANTDIEDIDPNFEIDYKW